MNETQVLKDCEGCYSKRVSSFCNSMYRFTNDECPCAMCLIKVMCNDSCDEYEVFWKGVDSIIKDKNARLVTIQG